jgi:integrase
MERRLLTTRAVEAAKPKRDANGKAVRTEIPDAGCVGLYLVVQPTGTRSWAFRYRRPDRTSVKLTLGNGGMSLAVARHAAVAARHKLEQGTDPAPQREPMVVSHTSGDTIESAIASFLELHARRKNRASTAWAAERIFNRLVLPAWRGRSINSIRKRDVIDLVEAIAGSGRGYLANRTLGVLSKFFNWLVARDVLASSPVTGVERPHKEKARARILSDEELRALWLACEGDGPFGQALKLMILTGARRNEASHMRWSERSGDNQRLWTLPPERTKNGREHVIPLSSQAWEIIESMPHFAGCNFVFSADGRKPIVGWAKTKTRFSAKAGIVAKSWRLHDLRRTAASGMQRLGISVPVIEKALNHISGTFRGIVGVYQQHEYADEIRAALQKWADHVEQLVAS